MIMLVIGALVIGYLIYFFSSSVRAWSNQRAVDRTNIDKDHSKRALIQIDSNVDAKTAQLEQRIAVLERLIEAPAKETDD